MVRGLILGSLAFAGAFAAERQFETLGRDVKRYNMMRAMSGDPPLYRQALAMLGTSLAALAEAQRPALRETASALLTDLTRYLRMRAM